MTAEEFTRFDANRSELEAILNKPIFQLALGVLREEIEPSIASTAKANPVLGASLYQQVAGANHIIHGLNRLTQPFKAPVTPRGKVALSTEIPVS